MRLSEEQKQQAVEESLKLRTPSFDGNQQGEYAEECDCALLAPALAHAAVLATLTSRGRAAATRRLGR